MDDEIKRIIAQIKTNKESEFNEVKEKKMKDDEDEKRINSLLEDIEKEFADLDDILNEVDVVK